MKLLVRAYEKYSLQNYDDSIPDFSYLSHNIAWMIYSILKLLGA